MLALRWREAVGCCNGIGVTYAPTDDQLIRLAQSPRRLGQGIEHRLKIESRAADHLEHIGSGGLLLKCLGELPFAGFELLFEIGVRLATATGARSRLRSSRSRLATARWTLLAPASQASLPDRR